MSNSTALRFLGFLLLSLGLATPGLAQKTVLINHGAEFPNGVPNYAQASFAGDNDCGPTAAAMMLGYYAANGWPYLVPDRSPYYNMNTGPGAGLVQLDARLKERLPYSASFGTWDVASAGSVSDLWSDIRDAACDMDPGAGAWSGDDDQWVDEETIRQETGAGRPVMFNVRLTDGDMWWNDVEGGVDVEWHWLTTIGYEQPSDPDDFYVLMRSGWRQGGNQFLFYSWAGIDDLYIVKLWPGGASSFSVGPHILLTEPGGWATVVQTNGLGGVSPGKYFSPRAGWTARAYERFGCDSARLMWSDTTGRASVWKLDRHDNLLSSDPHPYVIYNAGAGHTALGYCTAADGTGRILWRYQSLSTYTPGHPSIAGPVKAVIWILNASGVKVATRTFQNSGFEPVSYLKLRNGAARLLWRNAQGGGRIWQIDGTEQTQLGNVILYGSTDLVLAGLVNMSDGTNSANANASMRLLKTNPTTGATRVIRMDSTFGAYSNENYGPWVSWTARSFSEK